MRLSLSRLEAHYSVLEEFMARNGRRPLKNQAQSPGESKKKKKNELHNHKVIHTANNLKELRGRPLSSPTSAETTVPST